jgi:hypothetical protein
VISKGDEAIVSGVVAAEHLSGYLVNEYDRRRRADHDFARRESTTP